MPLLKNAEVIEDPYTRVSGDDPLPEDGAVLVDLERWQSDRENLIARNAAIGVRLASSQAPAAIVDDLEEISLVALDFPAFTDGRAYSYARLLRERHGYRGEVRAVGDVALEQLHFMDRSGFDAFELASDQPVEDWLIAQADMKLWYQPTGDERPTVSQLRRR